MKCWVVAVSLAAFIAAPSGALAQSAAIIAPADEGNALKDAWLTSKTKTKMLADGRVKSLDINVETNNSVVTLRGKVATVSQRTAAEQIARGVDGVRAVTNALQVVPNAFRKKVDDRDDEIKKAIEDRLSKDGRLKEADIKVRADAGLVTLMGKVPDAKTKARAIEMVRAMPGVRAVKNELK
jgi:hyperosmotically inducible periplasmic protein